MSYMWDAVLMRILFRIAGGNVQQKTTRDFWANLFAPTSLKQLHLGIEKHEHADDVVVAYHHIMHIPPDAFDATLAILATRQIMDALSEPGQIRMVLRWNSKAIWDGALNGNINTMTITSCCNVPCSLFCVERT